MTHKNTETKATSTPTNNEHKGLRVRANVKAGLPSWTIIKEARFHL